MHRKSSMHLFTHSPTSLINATALGESEVCEFLLKFGVDVDAQNPRGQKALMIAAERGHSPLVALFLSYGAKLDMADSEGKTALMYAAFYGQTKLVAQLQSAGANIQLRNNLGETALTLAQRYGHFAVASLLMQDRKPSVGDFARAWYQFAKSGWQARGTSKF